MPLLPAAAASPAADNPQQPAAAECCQLSATAPHQLGWPAAAAGWWQASVGAGPTDGAAIWQQLPSSIRMQNALAILHQPSARHGSSNQAPPATAMLLQMQFCQWCCQHGRKLHSRANSCKASGQYTSPLGAGSCNGCNRGGLLPWKRRHLHVTPRTTVCQQSERGNQAHPS